MKYLIIILFSVLSFAAMAQPGSATHGVYKSRVNDTTAASHTDGIAAAIAAGYAYEFWNNQAATPHWDIWTDAGLEHVFTFAGTGGAGVTDGDKGDITVSGTGATWTVDAAAITYAKFQNLTGLSIFGRSANSSGVGADITAGSDHQVLRRSGTSIGFGAVDLSQATAVTGLLPNANQVAPGSSNQVLYNASNIAAADADFTFNPSTSILDVDTVTVTDDAYDETDWNGNNAVPTKNAVRDLAIELGDLSIGSITGAISLTSDDLGTLWELSGTSVNYAVDLPTAVGNDEKTIIFKGLSGLTKNVTVTGISGQTIDGYATYVMSGGGSITLLSDGANWTIVNAIGSWINYTPVWDGFSVDPTILNARYFLNGKSCTVVVKCNTSGTSDATNLTITLPFAAAYGSFNPALAANNGNLLTNSARLDTAVGSSVATAFSTYAGAAWTASNGKRLDFILTYEIQ